MFTKLAVRYLTKKLKKDKDLWYAYQSNIAMVIYDNLQWMSGDSPLARAKADPKLHEFCNKCANDFLKLWTK